MKKILLFLLPAALMFVGCEGKNNPDGSGVTNDEVVGRFSVSANTKVQFSQGNLQYQASTNTWRFASEQYESLGELNENISSSSYTGWIDLFGWGTGANPMLSSTDWSEYDVFVDWGVNAISNGGNKVNYWRTLSGEEWAYLISNRKNAANLCGQASVAGVHGFILLPDDWSAPQDIAWKSLANNWTDNQYTKKQWAKMENAGAVFLPATGYRFAYGVYNGDYYDYGNYWSNQIVKDSWSLSWTFYFDGEQIMMNYHDKCEGHPVRLVRNL